MDRLVAPIKFDRTTSCDWFHRIQSMKFFGGTTKMEALAAGVDSYEATTSGGIETTRDISNSVRKKLRRASHVLPSTERRALGHSPSPCHLRLWSECIGRQSEPPFSYTLPSLYSRPDQVYVSFFSHNKPGSAENQPMPFIVKSLNCTLSDGRLSKRTNGTVWDGYSK